MKKGKRDFMTGQVAEILHIGQQTVIREFDKGHFPGGYQVPGSRFRRIPLKSLLAFAEINKIPINEAALERIKKKNNLNSDIPVDSLRIESTVSQPVAKTAESGPIRVLVVDREDGTTSTAATILKKRNCEVRRIEELFPAGAMAVRFLQDIILVGSAFAGNLRSIIRTFPGEQIKILQETEDGYPQGALIDNYLEAAYERRRQKENREHNHPQIILCA